MAVVDITRAQRRVIGIINAAPGATDFPSTASAKQGRYPSTTEIQYAIFEADNALCRDVILTGHPWRIAFEAVTDPLTNNSALPAHLGGQGMIEVSDDDSVAEDAVWLPAVVCASKDETTEVIANPTLYGLTADGAKGFAWIEDDRVFTTSPFCRVRYPDFTPNNSTCQSNAALEDGVVAGAVSLLFKDGSDGGLFDRYKAYFADVRAELRAGAEVFPVLSQADLSV